VQTSHDKAWLWVELHSLWWHYTVSLCSGCLVSCYCPLSRNQWGLPCFRFHHVYPMISIVFNGEDSKILMANGHVIPILLAAIIIFEVPEQIRTQTSHTTKWFASAAWKDAWCETHVW
jgi:hypothetical protein